MFGCCRRSAEANLQPICRDILSVYGAEGRRAVADAVSAGLLAAVAEGPRATEQFAAVAAVFVTALAATARAQDVSARFLEMLAARLEQVGFVPAAGWLRCAVTSPCQQCYVRITSVLKVPGGFNSATCGTSDSCAAVSVESLCFAGWLLQSCKGSALMFLFLKAPPDPAALQASIQQMPAVVAAAAAGCCQGRLMLLVTAWPATT